MYAPMNGLVPEVWRFINACNNNNNNNNNKHLCLDINCFTDSCHSSPCKHGGTCMITQAGYTCKCKYTLANETGFMGTHCEGKTSILDVSFNWTVEVICHVQCKCNRGITLELRSCACLHDARCVVGCLCARVCIDVHEWVPHLCVQKIELNDFF